MTLIENWKNVLFKSYSMWAIYVGLVLDVALEIFSERLPLPASVTLGLTSIVLRLIPQRGAGFSLPDEKP